MNGGNAEIVAERVDRLAEWLEVSLGTRLVSFVAGVSAREVHEIVQGAERPDQETERRLRNLFGVATLLAARDGAGFAYMWLTEPNPALEGRTPASMLHDGKAPESVWFAAAPTF